MSRYLEMTSRTATTGINPPSGSRGAVTKYTSGAANLFPPLPAGSIARGSLLKSPDALHPSLQKFILIERALLLVNGAVALVFALYLLFAKLP